jgi:hypothetical protein
MDRLARHRIVRLAHRREQDAQIIEDLRRRRDGRPRVGPRAPLLDCDRRRQPFNKIHIRLFHLVEELPGIGRQALDVPPLPLGIERVEGER